MEKKKVLFLINNLEGGGAEKVLVNLVNHMNHNLYDITLRTLINQGPNKKFLSKSVTYEYVFKKGFRGVNYLHLLPNKYIYNKVAHGNFDIIIVYLHGVLTKIISKAPRSQKKIAYLHANMLNSPFIKSFRNQHSLENCFNSYNAIVSVSKSVQDSFIKASGITNNLHVIYNTFDVSSIQEKSKEEVTLKSFETSKLKICAIGTLNKIKGFDRLITTLSKVKKINDNFVLHIIGDGVEKTKLEQLILKHELSNQIFLLGFQDNPYKFLSKSDVFVSSSHTEGFSSVVVESTILGIPTITTDTSGMKEILGENNDYGIIVPNNEDGLYNGILSLLNDKITLEEYKLKVIERANFFSTKKSVQNVENLIDLITE